MSKTAQLARFTCVRSGLAIEWLNSYCHKYGVPFPEIDIEKSELHQTDVKASFCDSEGNEVCRVNYKLKAIWVGKQRMDFDVSYVTLSTAKEMGWKEEELYRRFGDPQIAQNPYYKKAAPMKLYPKHWLER